MEVANPKSVTERVVGGRKRVGDLEVSQDLAFENRMYKLQLVGWALMAGLLVAALLGVFGQGPLSGTSAGDETIRVEYERFLRKHAPQEWRIHLGRGTSPEGGVRLWIQRDFFEAVQLKAIRPEPKEVEIGGDGQTLLFLTGQLDGGGLVRVVFEPEQTGTLASALKVGDGPAVRISQFVYP